MTDHKAFYVTTPIYYVNDKPHIGHAYTTIACDFMARFKRADGYDVRFLTGTDEHGQKVAKSAAAAGVAPIAFCDSVSQVFRDLGTTLNISFDDFIRTTESRHIESCKAIWSAIEANGDIYLGSYSGWYAVRDEAFYGEDELQVDADGIRRAPSGAEVEWLEEPSYFFRLADWQDRLLAFYEANPDFILPASRRNEVISFVKGGLRDLSISRTSFTWGVPVPGNDKHVMYVWLDALTNYITAIGHPNVDHADYKTYWPADIHVVGKDILRFHAVYWPAFLMSAGLQPPKRIYAHGWWTYEGEKISKSLGNAIDATNLVERFGLDQLRYFLLREMPFGNDGDFSENAMMNRVNGDLANDFGNLCQRVLSMIHKNCDQAIPAHSRFNDEDQALLSATAELLATMRGHMDRQALHLALAALFEVIGDANRYVDAQAPWTLRKTDPARMATVLYVLAECIRHLAILAHPVMPDSAGKILDQLQIPADARNFAALSSDHALTPGTAIEKPQGVFPRYQPAA